MDPDDRFLAEVKERERALVDWWTGDADPLMREPDRLDIGWAGAASWATGRILLNPDGLHLDLCSGFGSFLAHLGWRFPALSLVGLNVDFDGPHAKARELLDRAGVGERCALVRADARAIPFADGTFDSASCFLGFQDVLIGFGERGVGEAILETRRVVKSGGQIVWVDDSKTARLCLDLNVDRLELRDDVRFEPDVRWDRVVGERAIEAFARGWVAQMRLEGPEEERAYRDVLGEKRRDMERQLRDRGYFNPLDPIRLLVFQKT